MWPYLLYITIMMPRFQHHHTSRATATAVALLASVSMVFGQTKIVAPDNKYSVQEDVKAGREAAAQVQEQLPILRDDGVDDYVDRVGARLVDSIPSEFRHPQFQYTFDVVNVSDINAFALPGGPMFVNRGMIEAARNEGEMAGVLAHEISHVALRHGTAQAGKATPYQVGSILGQIAGATHWRRRGATRVARIAVRFRHGIPEIRPRIRASGRSAGRADHGARRVRPRDMATMFQTIQAKSGNGGPEWLSNPRNPSNRSQAITQEAAQLRRVQSIHSTPQFTQVKSRPAADAASAQHRAVGATRRIGQDIWRSHDRQSYRRRRSAVGPLRNV
jgi:predicted Zn-dependent protease